MMPGVRATSSRQLKATFAASQGRLTSARCMPPGKAAEARQLLEASAYVNAVARYLFAPTLLLAACDEGNSPYAKLLLDR